MTDLMHMIDVYRIDAWTGPRPRQVKALLRTLITGRQPSPPAIPVTRWAIRRGIAPALLGELARPWRIRRPWQAEARWPSHLNARRGWTAGRARRAMAADVIAAGRAQLDALPTTKETPQP